MDNSVTYILKGKSRNIERSFLYSLVKYITVSWFVSSRPMLRRL